MKAATVKELKTELSDRSQSELITLCLRLSRFKKENKELLTYLLFEAQDEDGYISVVKEEIEDQFLEINTTSYYFIKKSVRKILRNLKKYIRYSGQKQTEVELLIHFCSMLKRLKPGYERNTVLKNLYLRQLALIKKTLSTLDPDLQYDYQQELANLQ